MARFDWDKANRRKGGARYGSSVVGSSEKPKMCIFYFISRRKNIIKCRKVASRNNQHDARFCVDHQGSTQKDDGSWLADKELEKQNREKSRVKKEMEKLERQLNHELITRAKKLRRSR